MKKHLSKASTIAVTVFVCVLFTQMTIVSSVFAQNDQSAALKAYQLRMDGKAGDALKLIEEHIKSHDKDAAAYFELARIRTHMMLGNPRERGNSLDEIMTAVETATSLEPENVAYAYFAAGIALMQAYSAMHDNKGDMKEQFEKVKTYYGNVLKLKPDYTEAALNYLEILVTLAEEDEDKLEEARSLSKTIAGLSALAGAKAEELLLDSKADRVAFWNTFITMHGESPGTSAALARAYASNGDAESAGKFFMKSFEADPNNSIALLDFARFGFMYAMRNADAKEQMLGKAASAMLQYLENGAPAPLKAYTYGGLAKLSQTSGDKQKAKEYRERAEELDPYYSKAFGVPGAELFSPPGEVVHEHRYLFAPF